MKIGLIDVDGHNFPNLPLMKISSFYKANGCSVEFADALQGSYDKVYISKVFTFTSDYPWPVKSKEFFYGGTGYGAENHLPEAIEMYFPDYSLYPKYNEAYGFLTRGCPRQCKFCIVSQKEGCISHKVVDLDRFWNGQKEIKLLDPNLLGCRLRNDLLLQLVESGAWIDFTQGLDARLLNEETTELIMKCKTKMMHFAWDNKKDSILIYQKLKKFKLQTNIDMRKARVYVLTNYDTDFEFDLYRVNELKNLGYDPYVMIYDKFKFVNERTKRMYPMEILLKQFTLEQISHFKQVWMLSRWVNNKIIFRVCKKFEEYRPELG